MRNNNLYVDIHVIQNVPPSCVNRDDTGSPKTAEYGGVTRARVSSQSWKHAMRDMFMVKFDERFHGTRTRHVVEMVAKEIRKIRPEMSEKEINKRAKYVFDKRLVNGKKKSLINVEDNLATVMVFFNEEQARALAELELKDVDDAKEYIKVFNSNPSYDMTLFGRMVAADAGLNIDAAAQVSHAISTHAVHNEYDYFTAVDDLSKELDETGAGHIGVKEFNSSTLYRYASVNVNELKKNHAGTEADIVAGFVEAFVRSMPTGSVNTYANNTLPALVYVTVRRDTAVYLGDAFENPIKNSGNGFVAPSVERLSEHAKTVYENYCAAPYKAFAVGYENYMSELAERVNIEQLLDKVRETIADEVK